MAPASPAGSTMAVPADASLWDRIGTWVENHKAVVYTVAGVTVLVTGAGAVYYLTKSNVSKPIRTNRTSRSIALITWWPCTGRNYRNHAIAIGYMLTSHLLSRSQRIPHPDSARRSGGKGNRPRERRPRRPRLPPLPHLPNLPRLLPQSRRPPQSRARTSCRWPTLMRLLSRSSPRRSARSTRPSSRRLATRPTARRTSTRLLSFTPRLFSARRTPYFIPTGQPATTLWPNGKRLSRIPQPL